ncbi:hypothetical protein AHF37_00279 [Paragonimus kellicotti]|nr:hypothetical protein AHF37_00279 [Paragonimus kellicotti]
MDLRLFIFCASVLCVFLHVLVWDSDRTTRNVGFHGQSISMSTNAGENYECTVPPLNINEKELFRKQPCSIRVEFYWSYELCHKKHIRQFHEELLPDK